MGQGVRILAKDRDVKEFWKPERSSNLRPSTCASCGDELLLGSRFCQHCGSERGAVRPVGTRSFADELDWASLRSRLGLSTPSLVCAALGFAFALAALMTGIIYTASTALDWQAIQVWRIEWMLAALVAFAAAILLNKR